MFFIDYWYIVLVVPAILLGLLAQSMVSAAFNKYSKIRTSYGYTAEQVARQIWIKMDFITCRFRGFREISLITIILRQILSACLTRFMETIQLQQ